MDFETPGRLPPLGRVTHHFQAPLGAFSFVLRARALRMSYAGHEDASGFPSNDVQLGGCHPPEIVRERPRTVSAGSDKTSYFKRAARRA